MRRFFLCCAALLLFIPHGVFAETPTQSVASRYCPDPSKIFKGSIYHAAGETSPWVEVMVDPDFEKKMVAERNLPASLPLTPVYDLVVRIKPEFNYYCIPGWAGNSGVEVTAEMLPAKLSLPVSIEARAFDYRDKGKDFFRTRVTVGPGVFVQSGMKDSVGRFIYEWKIKGWPNGIVQGVKLEDLLSIMQLAEQEPSKYKIDVIIGTTDANGASDPAEQSVPFGFCAPVWGSDGHKVTFMRVPAFAASPFVKRVLDEDIPKGFHSIEPYASEKNTFSHLIDLRIYSDDWLATLFASYSSDLSSVLIMHDAAFRKNLISRCGPSLGILYTTGLGNKDNPDLKSTLGVSATIPIGAIVAVNSKAEVTMHEFSHTFAGLNDEYYSSQKVTQVGGSFEGNLPKGFVFKNCTTDPIQGYTSASGTFGAKNLKGCIFQALQTGKSSPISFFRPSSDSLMRTTKRGNKFNTISCGYIMAAIKGEPTDKVHAERYWPTCKKLGTPVAIDNGTSVLDSLASVFNGLFMSRQSAQVISATTQGSVASATDPGTFVVESFADDGTITGNIFQFTSDERDTTAPPIEEPKEKISCPNPKRIIAVGGIGSTLDHPMFAFMSEIAPGAIQMISIKGNSVEENTTAIRGAIQKELDSSGKALVVAHSLGAILTFNIRDEFKGKPVEFIYIDPPYKQTWTNIPGSRFFSNIFSEVAAAINKAYKNDIADDPNIINWTNGRGSGKDHDPWTYPTSGNNAQRLDDLKKRIETQRCPQNDSSSVTTSTAKTNLSVSVATVSGSSAVLPNQFYSGPVTIFATIKSDAGGAAAGTFKTAFQISTDGDFFTTIGEVTTGTLSAGASVSISQTWNAAVGPRYLRVCADSASAVAESNEEDNCVESNVKIVAQGSVSPTTGQSSPVRKSLPPVYQAPLITIVTPPAGTTAFIPSGSIISISGSGFNTGNNNIVTIKDGSGNIVRTVDNVTSADGKTLSFTTPVQIPTDNNTTYTMLVTSNGKNSEPVSTWTFPANAPVITPASGTYSGLVPCGNQYYPASDPVHGGEVSNPCTFADFFTGIKNVTDALIKIALAVAAISFSYAGFLYMTAFGDEGKVEHAHEIFRKVVWGFVIMLGAWLIVTTIEKALVSPASGIKSFLSP